MTHTSSLEGEAGERPIGGAAPTAPGTEFTAKQIQDALIKAIRDGEPTSITDSLATLLAIHYPQEFERLSLAVDLAALLEGDER